GPGAHEVNSVLETAMRTPRRFRPNLERLEGRDNPSRISLIQDSMHTLRSGIFGTLVNNVEFFAGGDADGDGQLWRTDGTAAGTYLIKNLLHGIPGVGGTGMANTIASNGRLFFEGISPGQDGLWVSDGTTGGTTLLKQNAGGEIVDANGTV